MFMTHKMNTITDSRIESKRSNTSISTPEGGRLNEIQGQQLPINELNGTPLEGECAISNLHRYKNGYYIPLIYPLIQLTTGNSFLAAIITLKTFPANYWYWYESEYNYLPRGYNWLKQFVRFTDTGHLASALVHASPEYIPLAFTTHFLITAGYWGGKVFFKLKDSDDLPIRDLDPLFMTMWATFNHSVPLILLINKVRTECVPFTYDQLANSYLWLYTWFFCVYIPWRLTTGDPVYSVLSFDVPVKKACLFIGFVHTVVYVGHLTGYALSKC